MCGRYYVDDDTAREIEKVVQRDEKLRRESKGDIYPSQAATVITGRKPYLMAEEMVWGFPQYQKRGLLINARAETALERKMFRDSVSTVQKLLGGKYKIEILRYIGKWR